MPEPDPKQAEPKKEVPKKEEPKPKKVEPKKKWDDNFYSRCYNHFAIFIIEDMLIVERLIQDKGKRCHVLVMLISSS